jgi:curved DNA-binding protein CbpA
MKLESKYFDQIRVSPSAPREAEEPPHVCQWKGCSAPGDYKAPRGRGRDNDYYRFCLEHVRQFNASYNYFAGMSDSEIEDFRKEAITGHRPTWKLGADKGGTDNLSEANVGNPKARRYANFARHGMHDPHHVMDDSDAVTHGTAGQPPRRALKPLERKAFEALNLAETAQGAEIKGRFKELVKRHHPDANGGDRGAEDKLREIIQAYNYLKQAGLV